MTIALYARRKAWDVGEITVRLEHTRIHAADCADCATEDERAAHNRGAGRVPRPAPSVGGVGGHSGPPTSNNQGKLDRIEREISFTGALTGEQRQRLLEIAERCPVHRTLTSEISIRTQLT